MAKKSYRKFRTEFEDEWGDDDENIRRKNDKLKSRRDKRRDKNKDRYGFDEDTE